MDRMEANSDETIPEGSDESKRRRAGRRFGNITLKKLRDKCRAPPQMRVVKPTLEYVRIREEAAAKCIKVIKKEYSRYKQRKDHLVKCSMTSEGEK